MTTNLTNAIPPLRWRHTPVRGYRYAARPRGQDHPRPGQRAWLVREAGNPSDPWAVAVWVQGPQRASWRIGYLERAVAAWAGPLLDRGGRVAARVAGWMTEPGGRWRRPVLRVAPLPTPAPEPREARATRRPVAVSPGTPPAP
jgi:HIRAN domain-containing protein